MLLLLLLVLVVVLVVRVNDCARARALALSSQAEKFVSSKIPFFTHEMLHNPIMHVRLRVAA